ncbi:unnamed protein product, partial [Aphanomyces euteiches]
MDLKQGLNDSLHLLVAILRSTGEKVDGYEFSLIPQPMNQTLRDELPQTDAAYFKVTFHARSKCYSDNESLAWNIEPMPYDIACSVNFAENEIELLKAGKYRIEGIGHSCGDLTLFNDDEELACSVEDDEEPKTFERTIAITTATVLYVTTSCPTET